MTFPRVTESLAGRIEILNLLPRINFDQAAFQQSQQLSIMLTSILIQIIDSSLEKTASLSPSFQVSQEFLSQDRIPETPQETFL